MRNQSFGKEMVHSRFITLTGFVTQYWPKERKRKIDGIVTITQPIVGAMTAPGISISDISEIDDLDPLYFIRQT
jgi:hypothetical protein